MILSEYPLGNHVVRILQIQAKDLQGKFGRFKADEDGICISVVAEQSDVMKEETIAHEIIHSWLWKSGIHNVLDDGLGELICDGLGDYLAQLLRYVRALPPAELKELLSQFDAEEE